MSDRIAGLRRLFRFPGTTTARARADVDDEIAFHLAARARDLVAAGRTAAEADAEARREFGDVEAARRSLAAQASRRAHRTRLHLWAADAVADVRLAARGIARAPGFAAVVTLTLALGIGANATMLDLVDRLLLRAPGGVVEPDRVVRVYGRNGWTALTRSWPDYLDLRDGTRSFADVAAYRTGEEVARLPARTAVRVQRVTPSYLRLLGVRPIAGRPFADDEARAGGARVALVGERLWRATMGADIGAVGRDIRIAGQPVRVVGIVPTAFTGVDAEPVDLWLPLRELPPDRGNYGAVHVIARLAPGVALAAADRDANRANRAGQVADGLVADEDRMQLGALAVTRGPAAPREVRVARWLALTSVLALLAALANVANLLLARGTYRARETSLRAALGAGRGRLARQRLAEGMVLGLLGGAASLLVCTWASPLLARYLLPGGAAGASFGMDARAVALVAALAVLAGVACGAVAALQVLRAERAGAIVRGGVGPFARFAPPRRGREVLLVLQLACTLVLLVGAGLFVRSLQRVRALPLGFDADRLVAIRLTGAEARLDDTTAARLLARVAGEAARHAGVERVSQANTVPFLSSWRTRFYVAGRDPERWGRDGGGRFNFISTFADTAFAPTTGLVVLAGRWLTGADVAGAPPVAVVNEPLARAVWPDAPPAAAVGRCLHVLDAAAPCTRVVGVVRGTRVESVFDAPPEQYYLPLAQPRREEGTTALLVRVRGDASRVVPALRQALQREVPATLDLAVAPLNAAIDPVRRPWELGAVAFALFGALVLLVAATGVHGLVALAVAQRTAELGVRRALGASRAHVVRVVGRRLLLVTLAGVVVGMAAGAAVARAGAALLYDVPPLDPPTYVVAALALALAAVVASVAPLRRALAVSPLAALRDAG